MKSTDPPVVVEQDYAVSAERLWEAITEPSQMRQWFFPELEDFNATPGFETQFSIEHDGREYVHIWKLAAVDPGRKIVYDWSYAGCPGRGLVAWELVSIPDGSRLKLTNKVVETFPQQDPAFKRESCQAGWEYFLHERLKEYLAR
jgi:uncharacterized protein YndB with AHSA1/START domain